MGSSPNNSPDREMSDVDIRDLPLSSYEHLGQDALCAICYQPSVDNVSMCAEGHNACRVCADKMLHSPHGTKCPIGCAKLLHIDGAWISNRALNDVIKGTPFLCPHSGAGCKHSCLLADMATHVKSCGYTPMRCKCVGCNWLGPSCKWNTHMHDVDHGRYIVDMVMGTQERVDAVAKSHSQWGDAVDKRLNSMYSLFENLHKTCQAIELKINRAEDKRLPSVEEWRATQSELETTHRELETAMTARDRFFRERDEATFQLEQSRGQKRALEERDVTTNKQLHNMHCMLSQYQRAAPRNCPCRACSA